MSVTEILFGAADKLAALGEKITPFKDGKGSQHPQKGEKPKGRD